MIKAKYSNSFRAKMARIKRLPEYAEDLTRGARAKDATGVIEEYQDGIRKQSFGLIGLSPITVAKKQRQGLSKPTTPLYGLGDDDKRSLINCLRIRRLKNGYKVYPSRAMHHTRLGGKPIPLDRLFKIHENGAIVQVGQSLIMIPPRPAFNRAYRNHLIKMRNDRRETAQEVKDAMTRYIEKADAAKIGKFIRYERRASKYL